MNDEALIKKTGMLAAATLLRTKIEEVVPNAEDHLEDTPKRFGDFWYELTKYADVDYRTRELGSIMHATPTDNDEMITCGPIDFYSVCPHHLAPVVGKAWVGYVPDGNCIGLSKIPRLVRLLAARPIIQEDLTTSIKTNLEQILYETTPGERSGVIVVLKARHFCMLVRGVKVNSNCEVTTSAVSGCFAEKSNGARSEFFKLVNAI